MACLFGHKWDGCICTKCGKTRNEGHDWDGCLCRRCGETRDEQHDIDLCKGKCTRCGKAKHAPHHDWDGCICTKCGRTRSTGHIWSDGKCSVCSESWGPTNPRLSSKKPLSTLERIFLFTSGDGKTVLECPVAMGTLADTAGAPANDVLAKVQVDIIAKSGVAAEILQTGKVPDSLYEAIEKIDPDAVHKVKWGSPSVRPVKNPQTGEASVSVFIYP